MGWGLHSFLSKDDQTEAQVQYRFSCLRKVSQLQQSPSCHAYFLFKPAVQACRGYRGERTARGLTHGHCTKGMPKICAARHPPHNCHLALGTEPCQLRLSFLLTQYCVILQKIAVCRPCELRCWENQSNELFQRLTAMLGLQHHGTLNSIRNSRMLNFFAWEQTVGSLKTSIKCFLPEIWHKPLTNLTRDYPRALLDENLQPGRETASTLFHPTNIL